MYMITLLIINDLMWNKEWNESAFSKLFYGCKDVMAK